MLKFQLLCTTMNQKDFSKIDEMRINSDVIFANQCLETSYKEIEIKDGEFIAKMISTNTRGASKNRNILLTYADADICMLADDDVRYYDNYREIVLEEFKKNPNADMIVFNVDADSEIRENYRIIKDRRMRMWDKNPYGSVRVAFRLSSQRKMNIWFDVLLGPGGKYKSGEDTKFINDFRNKGQVYLCSKTIGKVDFSTSSWFRGYTEEYYFNQGAKIGALYGKVKWLMIIYYAVKIVTPNISIMDRIKLMKQGLNDYKAM